MHKKVDDICSLLGKEVFCVCYGKPPFFPRIMHGTLTNYSKNNAESYFLRLENALFAPLHFPAKNLDDQSLQRICLLDRKFRGLSTWYTQKDIEFFAME